ncbi:recombinase family protein [Azospirillum agricola]|uniref:recombinase family protein n=1 Tax=Azospirillum agricola TaxID=1720247 RepID=UPI000A0F359F|nr:recombinase family protein [Azospirillum agricola]SMH62814.1 Site-specific DNA recombinase [Azospirillum lipoferum]
MNKTVIYARYSSDNQREASIEDQIRVCRDYATRQGWTITNVYTDYAISGASMMRSGIQQLMQDAAVGKFDILLAEDLDRISRDQEDIAGIYKRIQFADARIVTLADGNISDLHIGLKGTMSARFLKDLAQKTHRGQRGRVEAGKSGGGNSYGYDVVQKFDARGEPIRGDRTINTDQARIVERIFREFARGVSPKAIAATLNREKIAGPAGEGWGPSTIYGNRRRGTGILNNELYIGKLVWNRLRYMKDPDTGKRVSRLNPESEWIITEVPEQRIIDQELWEQVKARQGDLNEAVKVPFHQKARPKNLLSYLLKCGECGGGFSMVSHTHLGCSSARNKGTCGNRLTIGRVKLEEAVLGALRDHLMDPNLCAIFCEEYTRHVNRLRMEHNAALGSYKRELESATRELDKLIDAIVAGVPASRVKDRMHVLEARRAELAVMVESTNEAPTLLHPSMAQHYRDEIQNLIECLNGGDQRIEAAELMRSLIDKIVLTPNGMRTALTVDLLGDLAGILAFANKKSAANKEKPLTRSGFQDLAQTWQVKMVEGTRSDLKLPVASEYKDKMVAGARNQRFLRLVEAKIPKLVA